MVHGNQAETLRDLVLQWTQRYPLPPLVNETLLVQSNGIAQWLRLSWAEPANRGGVGIAAALRFYLPSQFLWQAYRAFLGPDQVPEVSPLDKHRLEWRLVRLLGELPVDADFAPLQHYLSQDTDGRKRQQLAEQLADLFDQYQVYRADWLEAWGRGDLNGLGAADRWQGLLWRRLLADVAADDTALPLTSRQGRAAVHSAFLARAAQATQPTQGDDVRPQGLPPRIIVFGISTLPQQTLEVLAVLGRWCQVLLCVLNPCRHDWSDIVPEHAVLRAALRHPPRHPRRIGAPAVLDPDSLHLHAHPLLAAWGRQGRDFIGLLNLHDDPARVELYRQRFQAIGRSTDVFTSPGDANVLQQLQQDILELRPLAESQALWPAVDVGSDTSIRFHVTHGPQREVEVLHDQLLAAFEGDPTLEPRDVMVMVPDIATYAPHVEAVFGRLPNSDPRFIPFSISDQSRRGADPLLHAVQTLLELPKSRLTASDLLDLLDVPALARRFGFQPDDRPALERWIRGANIRWGLHSVHRQQAGLPPEPQDAAPHTWLFGMRRLLLGYATGEGESWQGIEPFGDVGGLEASALGALAQLLETLDQMRKTLTSPTHPDGWCERLRQLLRDCFDVHHPRDRVQTARDASTLLRLEQQLQDWQAACAEARLTEDLPLTVVAEHWLAGMDAPSIGQRFFGGAVTFATLMPMRAIPFRHICLLGMNDGDYPRQPVPMDFDLMTRQPRPGDRSRRNDDHYMLLEALLSARERLYISWVGHSIHDNSERSPSVLVSQLRDHLAAGWRLACPSPDGTPLTVPEALTTHHPLQPFNPAYFSAASLDKAAPLFTYAREWRQASSSSLGQSTSVSNTAAPLPPMAPTGPLSLADLATFLKDPARSFFQHRLGVHWVTQDDTLPDHEPFDLDGLQRWQLHRELLDSQSLALQRGEDLQKALDRHLDRLQARGDLATGGQGRAQRAALAEPIPKLMASFADQLALWPEVRRADVTLTVSVGERIWAVEDSLNDLRVNAKGEWARLLLEPSALADDQRRYRLDRMVPYWVQHLAAQLAVGPVTTLVLSHAGEVTLAPLPTEVALEHWQTLLHAWDAGMCQPLPMAARSGTAWLRALGRAPGNHALAWSEARNTYEGERLGAERDRSPYLRRAFADFSALAGAPEQAADSAFGYWVERLLQPLWTALPVARKGAPS